jgi:DNA-binding transcriptional LysR family regulator
MRSLNLDQLRTLIEVIDLGSFSAAARRLNLTQPAVSLQVRELELRFGVKLVERLGRTTHATVPGRELIEHGRRIFRECDNAMSGMRRYRDGWIGRVNVGTTNTAMTYELPPVLRRLRQEHPGIDLQVMNMPTCEIVEALIQNRIDLGLVTLPVDDPQLKVTPLCRNSLVAILPTGTPDIPDVITPEYAAQQSMVLEHTRGAVYGLVMQWLSKQLPLPLAPMHLGTVEAMKKVVGQGLGMSIVPDVAVADATPDVVVRPLSPPARCTLALAEHRCKPNEPALEIVRNALLGLKDAPEAVETSCAKHPTRGADARVWQRRESARWSQPQLMA